MELIADPRLERAVVRHRVRTRRRHCAPDFARAVVQWKRTARSCVPRDPLREVCTTSTWLLHSHSSSRGQRPHVTRQPGITGVLNHLRALGSAPLRVVARRGDARGAPRRARGRGGGDGHHFPSERCAGRGSRGRPLKLKCYERPTRRRGDLRPRASPRRAPRRAPGVRAGAHPARRPHVHQPPAKRD